MKRYADQACRLLCWQAPRIARKRNSMFERAILHLDLDAFFVSVEQLYNNELQGRPLIIGGSSGRGVVASCSYEARHFGIHAGMPIRHALLRCPDATVLRGDMENYLKHSRLVTEILAEDAPVLEKASIDEFYLDISGMDRYFGCWKWSQELRQKVIRESGLPLSIGLAANKLVSKVGAGESKPNGAQLVESGREQQFLAPLPVRRLPAVGKVTCHRLSQMGIRTVHALSQVPPLLLQREFGKPGKQLWEKAHGIDHRPVVPYTERQSISTERTFQTDTTNVEFLRTTLNQMVAQLAFELRQSERLTACITVKLRYSDFNTFTRQCRLPYTASDTLLLHHARDLLEQLYTRRQLVRLLGVRFSKLVPGHPQLSLFDASAEEQRLQAAMDGIRQRFGKGAVGRGNG